MKKIITILAVIGMFGFQGCTGPEGPPGAPGQDGLIGVVYENTSSNYYNFTASGIYTIRVITNIGSSSRTVIKN